VRSAAAALGLPIAAEWRAGVVGYYRLAKAMAAIVFAQPLTTADESGSVFVPVAAAGDGDAPAERDAR
jgi:hypothetical protein